MNALARALHVEAPRDSGNLRLGRVVRAIPAPTARTTVKLTAPTITIEGQHVRNSTAEGTFITQWLMFDQQTWAARNLTQVLGVVAPATDDELAAATKAVQSLSSRANEDVKLWAKELGETFGSFTD
ncbi:hypothetical protein NKH55_01875 [Mesorhizobium opportunistum]|uniref:hypothetical protein n=1 Tax=Mesorhizobium opportunistum TaxID=593909 RepID=UPI00333B918D